MGQHGGHGLATIPDVPGQNETAYCASKYDRLKPVDDVGEVRRAVEESRKRKRWFKNPFS